MSRSSFKFLAIGQRHQLALTSCQEVSQLLFWASPRLTREESVLLPAVCRELTFRLVEGPRVSGCHTGSRRPEVSRAASCPVLTSAGRGGCLHAECSSVGAQRGSFEEEDERLARALKAWGEGWGRGWAAIPGQGARGDWGLSLGSGCCCPDGVKSLSVPLVCLPSCLWG